MFRATAINMQLIEVTTPGFRSGRSAGLFEVAEIPLPLSAPAAFTIQTLLSWRDCIEYTVCFSEEILGEAPT